MSEQAKRMLEIHYRENSGFYLGDEAREDVPWLLGNLENALARVAELERERAADAATIARLEERLSAVDPLVQAADARVQCAERRIRSAEQQRDAAVARAEALTEAGDDMAEQLVARVACPTPSDPDGWFECQYCERDGRSPEAIAHTDICAVGRHRAALAAAPSAAPGEG